MKNEKVFLEFCSLRRLLQTAGGVTGGDSKSQSYYNYNIPYLHLMGNRYVMLSANLPYTVSLNYTN